MIIINKMSINLLCWPTFWPQIIGTLLAVPLTRKLSVEQTVCVLGPAMENASKSNL